MSYRRVLLGTLKIVVTFVRPPAGLGVSKF